MHSSSPNTSGRRRYGYTMRYMTTDVNFTRNGSRGAATPSTCCAAEILAGNDYGEPGRVFEPGKAKLDGSLSQSHASRQRRLRPAGRDGAVHGVFAQLVVRSQLLRVSLTLGTDRGCPGRAGPYRHC